MYAYDGSMETLPEAYEDLQEALPDDMLEILPDDFFSRDPNVAISAVEEVSSPRYILKVIWRLLGVHMGDILGLFATWLGFLILSAVWHQLNQSIGRGKEGILFCLRLCMYTVIISKAAESMTWVTTYFEDVGILMQSMLPIMGVLYAMGGNVGQAAVSGEMILVILNFCEYIAASIIPTLCGVCFAMALMEAMGGHGALKLAPISGLCKKWYTSILGFVMFVLTATLSLQSILASKADTWGMKGVKYAVGQMLPVVGGSVSGILGTVAEGVGVLRGVSGVSGVILLALLLLPTLLQLLLLRGCYQAASAVAGMLSCDREAKLLGEISSLYGYMAASVGIGSVAFIVALAIFARGSVAFVG